MGLGTPRLLFAPQVHNISHYNRYPEIMKNHYILGDKCMRCAKLNKPANEPTKSFLERLRGIFK